MSLLDKLLPWRSNPSEPQTDDGGTEQVVGWFRSRYTALTAAQRQQVAKALSPGGKINATVAPQIAKWLGFFDASR